MRNIVLVLTVLFTLVAAYWLLHGKILTVTDVSVDDAYISKTFTQLKGARLSRPEDLRDIFREPFRKDRYSFLLKGDFNRDGYPDYFISGQFEQNGKTKPFFALISLHGSKVIIEILNTEVSDTIMLKELEPGKIIAAYALDSNDFYLIYWDGTKYKTQYAGNPETLE